MNPDSKLLAFGLAALLVSGLGVGAPDEQLKNQDQVEFDDLDRTKPFNGFFDSLLSVSVFREDGKTNVEYTATFTESINIADTQTKVYIHKCETSTTGACEKKIDPAEIVARDDQTLNYEIAEGKTLTSELTVLGPDDPGTYRAIVGLTTDACRDGSSVESPCRYVTDLSKTNFVVEDSTGDGTTDDSSTDTSTAEPDLVAYKNPDYTVGEDGQFTGTVYFENVGGDMDSSRIVEMQLKTTDNQFLSFVGDQQVCDSSHPENVHKEFKLGGGEKASISLTSQAPETGEKYDVVFLTATECLNDGSGSFTDPYRGYTGEYRIQDVRIGGSSECTDGCSSSGNTNFFMGFSKTQTGVAASILAAGLIAAILVVRNL